MSETELIDWEQLSMIFGEDEEDFDEDMAELYQEFLEDAVSRLQSLRSADFASEKEVIAKEAHKLKGSASNFGLAAMAAILGQIETEIEELSAEHYASALAAADSAYERSQKEISQKFPVLNS